MQKSHVSDRKAVQNTDKWSQMAIWNQTKNMSWIPLFSSGCKRIYHTDAFVYEQTTQHPIIPPEISNFSYYCSSNGGRSLFLRKCMRAVCISSRATLLCLRSHMPGICYNPAKAGLNKKVCSTSIQLKNSEAEHRVSKWNIHHLKKWHLLQNTDWQLKSVHSMHE